MRKTILLTVASASLFLAACSKVTQENYDKVDAGMSRAEIEAVLGKATNCSQALGTASCIWGDDEKHIKVKFVADTAALVSSNGI